MLLCLSPPVDTSTELRVEGRMAFSGGQLCINSMARYTYVEVKLITIFVALQ